MLCVSGCCFMFENKSPSTLVVKEKAATLFGYDAPQIIFGLHSFTRLYIGMGLST